MDFDGDLMRGVVEPVVLKLVAERACYGYEIIKVVNERTSGAFAWKEGTLYPCLHRLENAGLIAGDWRTAANGKPRKYYAITRKGAAALRGRVRDWAAFAHAVNAVLLQGTPA